MIPVAVEARYRRDLRVLAALERIVQSTLWKFCRTEGYALSLRLKTLESLAEKLESGRFGAWSQIDDLLACTIVIPTLDEEESVLRFLKHTFDIDPPRLRGATRKAPEVFRFEATRVTARLRTSPGLPAPPVALLPFEIQVRTAFEHAWSVATHSLAYKGESISWKHLRLASQLKAAVEQLDLLVLGFDGAATKVLHHDWFDVAAPGEAFAVLDGLFARDVLPAVLRPANLAVVSRNIFALAMASARAPRREREGERRSFWNEAVGTMKERFEQRGTTGAPRALSLFQYALGELTDAGVLMPPLDHFVVALTSELRSLYPRVEAFATRFDFEPG